MISAMVLLGILLRFFRNFVLTRQQKNSRQWSALQPLSCALVRSGKSPLRKLVPGDIVLLSAGDMVPADVRLISAKDLHINQSALTGEALPVAKSAERAATSAQDPLEMPNICFLGSNVEVGSATAVVVLTGGSTYLGSLATSIAGDRELTGFDKGITTFTWLMIKFL